MLGAIVGDIVGSRFQDENFKSKEFDFITSDCYFTDDTIMTVAITDGLMNGGTSEDFIKSMKKFGWLYPDEEYGIMFYNWLHGNTISPYNAWSNGSAMRVSPIGWWYDSLDMTEKAAKISAAVTHNHPEGIKGAQAIAASIFLARTGESKENIKAYISDTYKYDLSRTLDAIRPKYDFDISCRGTVPESIIAFLESNGFEDAIRNAISIGGDCDTIAAMTGGIAQAAYGIPDSIQQKAISILEPPLLIVINRWQDIMNQRSY